MCGTLKHVIGRRREPAEEVTALALVDVAPRTLAVVATRSTLSGWDVLKGQRLWRHTDTGACDLAVVPGRRTVVAACLDGIVTLLDPSSGDEFVLEAEPGLSPGRAVTVDADGRLAITAEGDSITIWDLESRRLVHRIAPKDHVVKAVAVTPPPSVIVSLGDRGHMRATEI